MSMRNHLAELKRKHVTLEKEIEASLAHPSAEPLKIAHLKRRKLSLKDEIRRCSSDPQLRSAV